MKMKMAAFGAPKGFYVAKFLGLKPFTESKIGRDGKPMEPGMEWRFEIGEDPDHDGAYVGVSVGRITSQEPTAGNACGTLLGGLVDRDIKLNEEVDTDPYVGQLYRVSVQGQKDKPDKTQVVSIVRIKAPTPSGAQPVASSGAPPRQSAPKPPPPRPTAAAPVRYWVDRGESEPVL